MAKQWFECKGWSIWNTNTCLQHGNEPVGGAQYNYQWSGGGGLPNMPKWQNDEVGWWKRKHGAKDNMFGHDEFGWNKKRHETNDNKVKNGFQWCEHHTYKLLFYFAYPK